MLTVSEIYIYPIKSMGALALPSAEVTDRGLKYDRRWMLVDENGQFMSQRTCPAMALFHLRATAAGFEVIYQPDGSSIFIAFKTTNGPAIDVTVWDDTCTGTLVNNEASAWFSARLQRYCRLVYMNDDSRRLVDERYTQDNELVSFADAYPFLLIGQGSMDALNHQLTERVGVNRFRPNIVFTGGEAHQEDIFAHVQINGINFFGVKPCARCVMIGIDPATGKAGKEPTRTLARYRTRNKKIYFGQNLIHEGVGEISVGDAIIVRKTKPDFMQQPTDMPLYMI